MLSVKCYLLYTFATCLKAAAEAGHLHVHLLPRSCFNFFFPHLTSTYNDSMLQSPSCDTGTETRDVTTGDDNLDALLITHLKLCKGLLQVRSSLWVSRVLVVIVDSGYRQRWICSQFFYRAERLRIEIESQKCRVYMCMHRMCHTKCCCCFFSASGLCWSSK